MTKIMKIAQKDGIDAEIANATCSNSTNTLISEYY